MPYAVDAVEALPIRIGIEIEFLLGKTDPSLDDKDKDPSKLDVASGYVPGNQAKDFDEELSKCFNKVPDDYIGIKYISGLVKSKGYGVTSPPHTGICEKLVSEEKEYDVWPASSTERALSAETPSEPRFGLWTITKEHQIDLALLHTKLPKTTPRVDRNRKPVQWEGCEIASPVITDQSEIDDEFPAFEKILHAISDDATVTVNEHCGMHIHASPMSVPQGKPLDLEFVKRVVALTYILEIDHIHRVQDVERWNNSLARPITRHSPLAYHHSTEFSGTIAQKCGVYQPMLRTLESWLYGSDAKGSTELHKCVYVALARLFCIESLSELNASLIPGKWNQEEAGRLSWHCNGYSALRISSYHTIEFRYPEASFDTRFMRYWVCMIKRVFDIAQAPMAQFTEVFHEWFSRFVMQGALEVNDNDRHAVMGLDWQEHKEVVLSKTKHEYNVVGHFPGTGVDGFAKVVSSRTTALDERETQMWQQERKRLAQQERRKEEERKRHGEWCDCSECKPPDWTDTHIW